MESENPKVFICHSSDDKDRFVRQFATRLRRRGIDAWVDEWEISLGDSLVDRIFTEGIGDAEAVVVVLSLNSIGSKWVREEINAAFVRRVEQETRLIPVVIENCDVPVALQSTVYVRISNIDSYDKEFERIVSTILGINDKPGLAQAPRYTGVKTSPIQALAHVDNIVLKLACEEAVRKGDFFISVAAVMGCSEPTGIPEDDISDAIQILHEKGYIKGLLAGNRIHHFKITLYAFHEYAKAYISEIDGILTSVAARIVNDGLTNLTAIQEATGQPRLIVEYALDLLKSQGWIGTSGVIGGEIYISNVSPQLKRQIL